MKRYCFMALADDGHAHSFMTTAKNEEVARAILACHIESDNFPFPLERYVLVRVYDDVI